MSHWYEIGQLNEFLLKRKIASWPVRLAPLTYSYLGQLKLLDFNLRNACSFHVSDSEIESLENSLTSVLTEKNCLNFAVVESTRENLLGIVRLTKIDELSKRANLEYWLTPFANDRFFLSAMVREVSSVAFQFLNLYQVNISGSYSDCFIQELTSLGFKCKNEYIKENCEHFTGNKVPTCFYFNRSSYIKTFGRVLRKAS